MATFNGAYDFVNGEILLFDKPLGWTSFDLVNKVRSFLCREMKIKKLKVGHAGTLDPLATGLMVVCTGKATKQVEKLQAEEKEYLATLKLGATTPSFDLETEEDNQYPTGHLTADRVQEVLKQFTGTLLQLPPAFSAIKINGKRAYEHARKGADVVMPEKTVIIHALEMVSFEMPYVVLRICCSKGTYIRALARDIGFALGSGAYLTALRRTRSGNFFVQKAFTFETFSEEIASMMIK